MPPSFMAFASVHLRSLLALCCLQQSGVRLESHSTEAMLLSVLPALVALSLAGPLESGGSHAAGCRNSDETILLQAKRAGTETSLANSKVGGFQSSCTGTDGIKWRRPHDVFVLVLVRLKFVQRLTIQPIQHICLAQRSYCGRAIPEQCQAFKIVNKGDMTT